MLQITTAADYAIRAAVYIASQERLVTAMQVARTQQVPIAYISKILLALAQQGIIITLPGRKGGSRLKGSADEISILDIVEAVEGPFHLNRCLIHKGKCSRESFCPVHPFWEKTNNALKDILEKTKLSEFVKLEAAV